MCLRHLINTYAIQQNLWSDLLHITLIFYLRYFWLQSRCSLGLRFSGMLRRIGCLFSTDMLSRNVGSHPPTYAVTSQMNKGLEYIQSFIQQSVLRQVHNLFQRQFSGQSDLVLPLSISTILSFHEGHPVADYIFFLVFPSLPSFLLPFLQ